MPSWNPGAKLARLTFRLQGQGRGVVLHSSFHDTDWRRRTASVCLLRFGHEITAARLQLHAIPIYFDLQVVKRAVWLHIVE